jgi:CIC family chloride channel protein
MKLSKFWSDFSHNFGGADARSLTIAAAVGAVTGFGALGFRALVDAVTSLSFSGTDVLEGVAHMHWSLVLGLPVIGLIIVANLTQTFAREAKGHGVPEVMEAVAHKGGEIRPRLVVVKALASAINIGTGGSVGREGPIVQIGSAAGSSMGQLLKVPEPQMRLLVACGAAAGIAATFNAPLTGVVFAVEIVLGSAAIRVFSPIVVSSVLATAVSRWYLGHAPAFEIPAYRLRSPAELLAYVLLGVLAGLLGVAFVRVLYKTEDLFDRLPAQRLLPPLLGGLIVGSLALVLPNVLGLGYETIDLALSGNLLLGTLALLMVAKLVATSATLAGGGSGGVFAPSLFLGASLGGAFGLLANQFAPWPTASVGAYVLVSMGAVVAATTHAPLTAILIIFELSADYDIILPLMLACIIGTLLSTAIHRSSIYTQKLERRGIHLGGGKEMRAVLNTPVSDLMRRTRNKISPALPFDQVVARVLGSNDDFLYVADDKLIGVIVLDEIRSVLREDVPAATASDCMSSKVPVVSQSDTMEKCLAAFAASEFEELPVIDEQDQLVGIIKLRDVVSLYNREFLKSSDLGLRFLSKVEDEEHKDYVQLPSGHVVDAIPCPPEFVGKTLRELDLRREHGVMVVGLRHPGSKGTVRTSPEPDRPLEDDLILIVTGPQAAVRGLRLHPESAEAAPADDEAKSG